MILGLCDGHDAGAALVDGQGQLVFAVSEERLSRVKRQQGFPELALRACLAVADGIDAVAVAELARFPMRLLDGLYAAGSSDQGALGLRARGVAAWSRWSALGLRGLEDRGSRAVLGRRLRGLGLPVPLHLIDHHLAHARSAAAGIGDGLVLTLDAFGDGLCAAVFSQRGGQLRRLEAMRAPQSPALLYAQVTQLLGYGEGDEGKVVARAAQGDPGRLAADFERALRLEGGFRLGLPVRALRELVEREAPEDVCAALQARVESVVVAWVERSLRRHGGAELGLAGGLFANVAVNRAVVEAAARRGVERVFVFPAMGDAGLCAGAAWELASRRGIPVGFDEARVGPGPGELGSGGVGGEPAVEALIEGPAEAAEALLAGRIVARCAGRLEFGPRALGSRSLLLLPDRPERGLALNRALGRDPVMPFGPVMTAEVAPALLVGWGERTAGLTRYMTVALPASPRLRQLAPGAVHRDGTARAQVLDQDQDPALHAMLRRLPGEVCINTSLNRHGEPIVATADEAAVVARAAGARLWWNRSDPGEARDP